MPAPSGKKNIHTDHLLFTGIDYSQWDTIRQSGPDGRKYMEIFQGLYFRLYCTIHKSASVLQKFFRMFQILRCVDSYRFHFTDTYLYFISILQPAQLFQ